MDHVIKKDFSRHHNNNNINYVNVYTSVLLFINMDVGLFLGAGMSSNYGYPTTIKLKKTILESLGNEKSDQFLSYLLNNENLKDIEYVLDFLIRFEDLFDIDYIRKSVETISIGGMGQNDFDDLYNSVRKSRISVEKSVFRNYRWDDEYYKYVKTIFGTLYNKLKTENFHVFTTNYDRSIEKFCEKNDIECCDGFKATDWGKKTYDKNFTPKSNKFLKLYKLHGSLNWKKDGNDIKYIDDDKQNDAGDTNLIIYPTLSPKSDEGNYPYREYINEFKAFTSKNNICVAIGFSFRDFQQEFAQLLQNNGHLIIISKNGLDNFNANCDLAKDYSIYIKNSGGFQLQDESVDENNANCSPNSVYIYPEYLTSNNINEIAQNISNLINNIINNYDT